MSKRHSFILEKYYISQQNDYKFTTSMATKHLPNRKHVLKVSSLRVISVTNN